MRTDVRWRDEQQTHEGRVRIQALEAHKTVPCGGTSTDGVGKLRSLLTHVMRVLMHIRDIAPVFAVALTCGLFLKFFVVDAYRIPSGSMENTLRVGDYVLVNKFIYGATTPRSIPFSRTPLPFLTLPALTHPKIGDVLAFELPVNGVWSGDDGSVTYIKRCIAGPGDTVVIRDGMIRVNNAVVHLPQYSTEVKGLSSPGENFGPIVVPQDHYFVLGDHREASLDSRAYGCVPADRVIGKVMLIYWSWDGTRTGSLIARFSGIRWERIGRIIR